jgi:hypothetical protein
MGRGSIQVNARIGGCPDPGSEKRHSIAYVRPQANLRSLAFADWHPISRDPRPALLSGQQLHGRAEDVRRQKYSPISHGITY